MTRGLLLVGLAFVEAASAAPWPPRDPARALPVFETIWSHVEAQETCRDRARALDNSVRERLPDLVAVSTEPIDSPTEARALQRFKKRVATLDRACGDDADWQVARRLAHSLGFPAVSAGALPAAGRNQNACFSFVAHLNSLDCYPTELRVEQMCPRALDTTPLDMAPYYACLMTEMTCGPDGQLDAANTSRCSDALVPAL